jgi:hypothetical protein
MTEPADRRPGPSIEPLRRAGVTQLPHRLAVLVLAARDAEQAATGRERRAAFRTMRILLGGLIDAGYNEQVIAECIGVQPGSVRVRAEPAGELDAAMLLKLAAATGLDVQALLNDEMLGRSRLGVDGAQYYRAAAVVRGLASLP